MASPDLKHRPLNSQPQSAAAADNDIDNDNAMNRKKPKNAAARRGLKSLTVAVALPLSLALLDVFLFGSSPRYAALEGPFYAPPLGALHAAGAGAAFLSGLAAWLVWAEGGFHRRPGALALYLAQLGLGLAWYPLVLGAGAGRAGLAVCAALLAALVGCAGAFRDMNPIAGDLVRPCLAWALLLAAANVGLVYY